MEDSGWANTITKDAWMIGVKAGRSDTTARLRARIRSGLGAVLSGRSDVAEADLDDFTQDAVVRVIERLDTFRGDSGFTTWAMAVAVRVSLTALRRRRWATVPLDKRLAELALPISSDDSGSTVGARNELLAALRHAITMELTPRQRQVLLGEMDGIPQIVLAERLSSTPGAIYKVSHDARKKLKAALVRAGFDAETVRETLGANSRIRR